MNYNEETFWDNTQGQFEILHESNCFHDLILDEIFNEGMTRLNAMRVQGILESEDGLFVLGYDLDGDKMLFNFNKDKTAFFIRRKNCAIRIAKKWGEVGNCNWTLDMGDQIKLYTSAIITYEDLKPWKKK